MHQCNRRDFLTAAISSAITTTVAPSCFAQTKNSVADARRIDLHTHFSPPQWVANVTGRPLLNPANPRWRPEHTIEDMDRGGVEVSVISITNPGLWFGDPAQTKQLARACNEYGSDLVSKYPDRLGLFAAMPLPDVDATLNEIEYAFDKLNADGIGLFTSYNDIWLGAPQFRPVMEELNRRRAVVTVHPTAADCCRNLNYAPGVRPGTIEYGTDTTRAIIGITFSGDALRYPDIRFIWSHAGGSAPFLAGRIERSARRVPDILPNGFAGELQKFYFDVAGAANKGALASLLQFVDTSQIVFGTDFPPGGTSTAVAEALIETGLFSGEDLHAIDRVNALRLFPQFS